MRRNHYNWKEHIIVLPWEIKGSPCSNLWMPLYTSYIFPWYHSFRTHWAFHWDLSSFLGTLHGKGTHPSSLLCILDGVSYSFTKWKHFSPWYLKLLQAEMLCCNRGKGEKVDDLRASLNLNYLLTWLGRVKTPFVFPWLHQNGGNSRINLGWKIPHSNFILLI